MRFSCTLLFCSAVAAASLLRGAPPSYPFPDLEGMTFVADETVYTGDTLFEIIDGAAEIFLQYGFVEMRMGRYTNTAGFIARVEVYRHDSVANAFGIYSQERDPQPRLVAIGTQGYRGDGYLFFFTGACYVKTMTEQHGTEAQAALERIARATHRRLAEHDTWPAPLDLLPKEGRIAYSEQYIARSFLGRSFLTSAYVAKYGPEASSWQLFVIEGRNTEDAKRMLDAYAAAVPGGTRTPEPTPSYTANDPNFGSVALVLRGRIVAGVVDCPEEKAREAALAALSSRIAAR